MNGGFTSCVGEFFIKDLVAPNYSGIYCMTDQILCTLCSYHQKTSYMIDIAVLMDNELTQKENEKHERYRDLNIELEYSCSHH